MHTSSQWLIPTSTATAPATARSTKPPESVSTSMMTICFNGPEYSACSARYPTATVANRQPRPAAAAIVTAPIVAAAPSAIETGSAPDAIGRIAFSG